MSSSLRSPTAALIGTFLCTLLSPVVIAFYSFTVFFDALAKELQWGHGSLGLAITVGTLTIAVAAPIIGRIADRNGTRTIIIFGNIGLVIVVAAMSVLCQTLGGLYVAMAMIGILASCYLVAVPRIVSSWFDKRRGLALGFVMSGAGLGAALMAPLTEAIIESAGWQSAYLTLAAIVLIVSLPSTLLLVHEAPRTATFESQASAQREKPRITLQLVLLWFAFLLIGAGLHGVLIFFSPMLVNRGVGASTAAAYFSVASMAMFLGRLGCGYLLDRLPANRVGAVLMLGAASGILILNHAPSGPMLAVGALLFGIGVSAELDLLSYIVSRLYPIEYFSRFFGLAYSGFMIGTSSAPPLLGAFYDHFGDYEIGTFIAAALTCVSAFVLLAMRRTPTSLQLAPTVKGDQVAAGLTN
ncbi:MFS transporter [Phyllobacterium sp. YR531]|uniref:MFS transporter n=1 Tax=Phyllobacterium sp. YR531 TaxID=1144343 RepID=UPI00026FB1FC|nr:MFS transporter [Phyllobacterium sp. YR531]EJN05837.1 sugar phosphate permease [Phyllobacterium sp. YR531]